MLNLSLKISYYKKALKIVKASIKLVKKIKVLKQSAKGNVEAEKSLARSHIATQSQRSEGRG